MKFRIFRSIRKEKKNTLLQYTLSLQLTGMGSLTYYHIQYLVVFSLVYVNLLEHNMIFNKAKWLNVNKAKQHHGTVPRPWVSSSSILSMPLLQNWMNWHPHAHFIYSAFHHYPQPQPPLFRVKQYWTTLNELKATPVLYPSVLYIFPELTGQR